MTLPDFRIALGLKAAGRATRAFPKPRPSNVAARNGLTYERRVGRELERHIAFGRFERIEHNPWFTFHDTFGTANCSPDFLLHVDGAIIVVEVKLTWVEVALAKLDDLYMPVIHAALGLPVCPLVICRNVTGLSPAPQLTLSAALKSDAKLLQWPMTGHILWA
jgi:hypothetical protein